MCVNYLPTRQEQLEGFGVAPTHTDYPPEVYQDYLAPLIRAGESGREAFSGTFGMVPKRHMPPGSKHFTTMNARAETVGSKQSYRAAWRASQLCLVPMEGFYEPNWESGVHVRWRIGMADQSPFAIAGLWRQWNDGDAAAHSFTLLTVNADDHPLMRRFHKPGAEKRMLVVVPPGDYDAWLQCHDPELARSMLLPFPAGRMTAEAAPQKSRAPA